jgi:hypothetical protein
MTDEPSPASIKAKTIEDYIHESRMYGDVPKDQFGHQFKLLYHPQSTPKSQMELLPPDALLGLMKDSATLALYQTDIDLLNRFFDMGQRSKGVMDFFNNTYYSWWQQMRMTVTLGGTERWLQSFLEPVGVPYEGFSFAEKRQMKKLAKKKGIRDYMEQIRGVGGGGEEKIYD